jgi:hypothetical protein
MISRGSPAEIPAFLASPIRPSLTTIALALLVLLALDAIIGRAHQ